MPNEDLRRSLLNEARRGVSGPASHITQWPIRGSGKEATRAAHEAGVLPHCCPTSNVYSERLSPRHGGSAQSIRRTLPGQTRQCLFQHPSSHSGQTDGAGRSCKQGVKAAILSVCAQLVVGAAVVSWMELGWKGWAADDIWGMVDDSGQLLPEQGATSKKGSVQTCVQRFYYLRRAFNLFGCRLGGCSRSCGPASPYRAPTRRQAGGPARIGLLTLCFPPLPGRFMESELDLNDILQEMHVIATMPDLYHLLVELNAVRSLLGLLGHDNTDILPAAESQARPPACSPPPARSLLLQGVS